MKKLLSANQRLIITFASTLFIVVGTIIAIQFAKGYRPTKDGTLQGTGLLSASSNPMGALVSINQTLSNKVTNDTVNLIPGEYDVEIKKDGFSTWKKKLKVEAEVVTETDANLFRTVPSISPLTFSGADDITPSADGQKLAYIVASSSAETKAGLYVVELTDKPILFSKGPKLILPVTNYLKLSQAKYLWSPDSDQLLISLPNVNYLVNVNATINPATLTDMTSQLSTVFTTWEQELTRREKQLLAQLPEDMLKVATESAKNVYFSPDGQKVLYTATKKTIIPEHLLPPLPGSNSQPEARKLEVDNTYIYDLKEDKNFLVFQHPTELPPETFIKPLLVTDLNTPISTPSPTPATASATLKLYDPTNMNKTINNFRAQYSPFSFLPYQWFPTSKHILLHTNGSINIVEYDGTNFLSLYSGSFQENFFYPWPNGTKLIILTNLTNNPLFPANLYAINLK